MFTKIKVCVFPFNPSSPCANYTVEMAFISHIFFVFLFILKKDKKL